MITFAEIFQDKMVLQRHKEVKFWGVSDCEQTIVVYVNKNAATQTQKINGKFEIIIPPMEAMENTTLCFKGSVDTLIFKEVDIGEVWVAGGQSNMEFVLRHDEGKMEVIPTANDIHLRFYDVAEFVCESEKKEGIKDATGWGRWMTFNSSDAPYFSAVGFYFAQMLRKKLGVPVGIVGCNWGGTSAASWTKREYLLKHQKLRVYLDEYEAKTKKINLEKYQIKREKAILALKNTNVNGLEEAFVSGSPGIMTFIKNLPLIMRMSILQTIGAPQDFNRPGILYETMVDKIAGYTCKGFIWYQGESDDKKAELYSELFSTTIQCWRDAWGETLPFLFVQLAPFEKWAVGTGARYPELRQQQEMVSKQVKKTYMACIMDEGLKDDIHPKNKKPVGERLALLARGKVYGEKILCDSPELLKVIVQSNRIALQFLNSGTGLQLQGDKVNALEIEVNGTSVKQFTTNVKDDTVSIQNLSIKSSDQLVVRFAWVGYCKVNLINSAGLPVKPFIWTNQFDVN